MTLIDIMPPKEVIWGAIGTLGALATAGLGWLLVAGAQRAGDRRWVLRRERHDDNNRLAERLCKIDLTLESLAHASAVSAQANATQAAAMGGFIRAQDDMMVTMREFAADTKDVSNKMTEVTSHVAEMNGFWGGVRQQGAIKIITDLRDHM